MLIFHAATRVLLVRLAKKSFIYHDDNRSKFRMSKFHLVIAIARRDPRESVGDRDAGGARGADARDSPSFRRPILYSRNKISTTLSGGLYESTARKLVLGAGQSGPIWASRLSRPELPSAILLGPDRPRPANAVKAGSKPGLQARPSSYPDRFADASIW